MSIGRVYGPEKTEYTDKLTGARVIKLTDYLGHSRHLYFTNPGRSADGSRLVFVSDRENATNLFSIDLASYEITQITDLKRIERPREVDLVTTSVNPVRNEAYYVYGRLVQSVDLDTFETNDLYITGDNIYVEMTSVTADGKYLILGEFDAPDGYSQYGVNRGYESFTETFEKRPVSRIVKISLDDGYSEVIWEEACWTGHTNASPSQSNIITFCHEGPWDKVDHRIWAMDINESRPWKVRPCEHGETVGHEYWYSDGARIGFHGYGSDGRRIIGHINYDNTGLCETHFPHDTGHTHSLDERLIVGDADAIKIWKKEGDTYTGPHVLCEHRCSARTQMLHVHPRFTPDGTHVLFTSDMEGYGDVYMVDIP